jgi:hypothetical protein
MVPVSTTEADRALHPHLSNGRKVPRLSGRDHGQSRPRDGRSLRSARDRSLVALHQHQPGELVFDRTYRGGPRSDDFVLFHVTTGRNRSHETKQRFYARLVERMAATPGIRPEDVMVIIANSTFEDWSFASGVSAAASAGEGV